MTPLARRSPPALRALIAILDPTDDGRGVIIPTDLLAQHPELHRTQLLGCRKFLDQLLAAEETSNADLKGMLNRLAGPAWSARFEVGAAKSARRYLEELRSALSKQLA